MRNFTYETAGTIGQAAILGVASGQGQTDAVAQFLAGGTTLVDLMKLDVLRPQILISIDPLRASHSAIRATAEGLEVGALSTMSAASEHPAVLKDYPMIAQSLQLAASAQLRNMATLGGNVLQKTRCPYYRDTTWTACNKRSPGSGCAALAGHNRNHAVLGVDQSCIAQYPGDFGVALIALDAQVELAGAAGRRRIPFASLHTPVNGQPHIENTLKPGEIIVAFKVPATAVSRRSVYLKVRDRTSYEFAIASAAVGLDMDGETVRRASIGLGGMAYHPWRAQEAEQLLIGKVLNEATAKSAATAALTTAVTHGYNDYKPELARRTIVRALLEAKALRLGNGEG
jgi:xanthine dehydrogenase YagS FAD-binding subunit